MGPIAITLALAALLAASPWTPAQDSLPPGGDAAVRAFTDSLARDANGLTIAPGDMRAGTQVVRAGETIAGSIGAWHGNLDISGTVRGSAVAAGGNVILRPGAVVEGDALSVGGEVRDEGGSVGGESRSLSALSVGPLAAAVPLTPAQAARQNISLSVGWYLVLVVIALPVVLFARPKLETVVQQVRSDFGRSFLYGLLGQLALVPALIAICVGLAITILGILLIPFAVVAFVLAALGALALGFLAMGYLVGDRVMRPRGERSPSEGGPTFQVLLIGLSLFLALWVLGSAFTWAGAPGQVLRVIAALATWVAATAGFGATIASRGGRRRAAGAALPASRQPEADTMSWQTPTPVTGVTAARRPTPPPANKGS